LTPTSLQLARAFEAEIGNASSVRIGTHLNPDGDALGSALALAMYLERKGLDVEVLCHHPAPRNLRFLPGVGKVRQAPKEEKCDLAIMVDLESRDRLGDVRDDILEAPRLIVIDHHVPHEEPGDLRIVDVGASATALIIARLLLDLGAEITADMATNLLTGIVTDTGSFRFRNTTPEALSTSAILLERGADLARVNEEVFQRKPLASTMLLGHMLDGMRLECGNRIAVGVLSKGDFERAMATDEDTEGFVNEMLSIDSVEIAAILREPKPGRIRCSLRSRAEHDVATVAREFGGGGHRNAAGCTLDMDVHEAEETLVRRLRACLASC
jgi:phosphoesterase RecJ-like protein